MASKKANGIDSQVQRIEAMFGDLSLKFEMMRMRETRLEAVIRCFMKATETTAGASIAACHEKAREAGIR